MPIKIVTIRDVITVKRTATLILHVPEDASEEQIEEAAIDVVDNGGVDFDENQIDAEPWEVSIKDDEQGERLAALLTLDQTRLLDADERTEMETLIRKFGLEDEQIGEFKDAFPFGSPPQ